MYGIHQDTYYSLLYVNNILYIYNYNRFGTDLTRRFRSDPAYVGFSVFYLNDIGGYLIFIIIEIAYDIYI